MCVHTCLGVRACVLLSKRGVFLNTVNLMFYIIFCKWTVWPTYNQPFEASLLLEKNKLPSYSWLYMEYGDLRYRKHFKISNIERILQSLERLRNNWLPFFFKVVGGCQNCHIPPGFEPCSPIITKKNWIVLFRRFRLCCSQSNIRVTPPITQQLLAAKYQGVFLSPRFRSTTILNETSHAKRNRGILWPEAVERWRVISVQLNYSHIIRWTWLFDLRLPLWLFRCAGPRTRYFISKPTRRHLWCSGWTNSKWVYHLQCSLRSMALSLSRKVCPGIGIH